jgi:hypothetical protein
MIIGSWLPEVTDRASLSLRSRLERHLYRGEGRKPCCVCDHARLEPLVAWEFPHSSLGSRHASCRQAFGLASRQVRLPAPSVPLPQFVPP